MTWKSLLREAIVQKSKERLSREWQATGAPRNPQTHARVLRLLRQAGVKSEKEFKTYQVARGRWQKKGGIVKGFKPAPSTPQKK
jgi:hypothetical protein